MGEKSSEREVAITKIGQYQDNLHAEVLEDLQTGEHNYKYRLVEGIVMPPYVTPDRYRLSRTITTHPDDVCYISFPKSGSSWLANVIYLALHDGETPQGKTLRGCLHWLESSWPNPCERSEVDATPPPRIFKSHMPYSMALAGGPDASSCKYIYIARNPKDVAVSYYHFESDKEWSGDYTGPWEHWLDMFLQGKNQRGDWFEHVLSWWAHREADNMMFLTYEELLQDFDGTLDKLLSFIDSECAPAVLDKIRERSSFDYMRKDTFSNHKEIAQLEGFFRKGRIGSWKEMFTVAQSEAFDRVYEQRMAGSGLNFIFE
jgi:hypothetical protein